MSSPTRHYLGVDPGTATMGAALVRVRNERGVEFVAGLAVRTRQRQGAKVLAAWSAGVHGGEVIQPPGSTTWSILEGWLRSLSPAHRMHLTTTVEAYVYHRSKKAARGDQLVDTASRFGELAGLVGGVLGVRPGRPTAVEWRHAVLRLQAGTKAKAAEQYAQRMVPTLIGGVPRPMLEASGHFAEACCIALHPLMGPWTAGRARKEMPL